MKEINFTKMVAAGNDFVVVDQSHLPQAFNQFSALAKKICERKYGVGADGLLVMCKSRIAGVRMRIFNADGSEAEMCGNGARCAALYSGKQRIETKAGIIEAAIKADNVRVKLTDPRNLKLNIPIKVSGRQIRVNFVNTGVPHTVIFVQGLEKIDAKELGRELRFHKQFHPAGTNVDFVEVRNNGYICVRTYERGVEDETLACGTGTVASAIIFAAKSGRDKLVKVRTKSQEVLKVYFDKKGTKFSNVWLEGKAGIVFKGVFVV